MKEITDQLDYVQSAALITKKEITTAAHNMAKAIAERGEQDPLKLQIRMKRAALFLQEMEKALEDHVLTEAEQYGEKEFSLDGAKIAVREVGVKYDYSVDEAWQLLKQVEDAKAAKRKEHEAFLRSIKESKTIVDDQTGEVYTHHPIAKTSKTKAVITLT